MLISYVSDENFVALSDVTVELVGAGESVATRSRASGAVHADVPPGRYTVYLSCPGYGSKHSEIDVAPDRPVQLRLLRDTVLGYAWPKWVRAGEEVEVRVHSRSEYRVELWRYGWEKQLVRELGYGRHFLDSSRNIVPDGDYVRTGVGWRDPMRTTAPSESGLYFFHVHTGSGETTTFPLVVAPAVPTAPIAVLTSSLTWNAYNHFGGRSNYMHPVALPARPSVNRRQDLVRYHSPMKEKTTGGYDDAAFGTIAREWIVNDYPPLSFDRPEPANIVPVDAHITDPIVGRDSSGLGAAEWRLLGWLEREGFAADTYSDVQLHTGVLDLDAYRVLVLNTHPEYWSRKMYDRVLAWVTERGGRLVYLGGNGVECEVELTDEHTMIVRNGDSRTFETKDAQSSRFFGVSQIREESLLGVRTCLDAFLTGAPYRVMNAAHWVFEGTGLADGALFGQRTLSTRAPGGASGHEMDEMTKSSPAGTTLLAKGTNPGNAGADMVYHQTASGGQVFSVGSITYPAALPVDDAVSRITANVLRRFTA
ncbi:carboxypeptidase-like regulatory domain-containing protein [Mesorhizobium sp. M1312]|uniref:carboxypeptidase-like regulatory domain-containing protein n=1 Tax=unclassified Mesorhizobium TaxID=325217 RepID=UPI00333A0D27